MTVPKLSGLTCPNCGASVELRTFGQAISVVCPNCHSVLDAKDPNVAILQKALAAQRVEPLIPLGSRGLFEGVKFEAIGFQVRTENDPDDGPDSWQEYLLYNPYRGYRYLTEYNGHWNFVTIAHFIPEIHSDTRMSVKGTNFQLFTRSTAETTYVIGEFPWIVHVGDSANVADYVAPPQMLSSETTPEETVWSMGTYTSGQEIWKAFGLPGTAPAAQGTFSNQPSPHAGGIGLWGTAWKLVLAAFILGLFFQGAGGHEVYRQGVTLASGVQMTPAFTVGGHESNLQIEAHNRGSGSFYLHYALVDQESGQARSFARSIGRDDRAVIGSVKPGRYALRMEAEPPDAQFDLTVRRNAGSFTFFWIAAVLIILPPIFHTWRRASMERLRWQASSR